MFVVACMEIKLWNGVTHNVLYAWAVCPAGDNFDKYVVARTDVNGTLVLASLREEDGGRRYEVVAYLTISDRQCGAYLIKVEEEKGWK